MWYYNRFDVFNLDNNEDGVAREQGCLQFINKVDSNTEQHNNIWELIIELLRRREYSIGVKSDSLQR